MRGPTGIFWADLTPFSLQGEQHPQLRAGLVLSGVGGQPSAGWTYDQALGAIKAGGRPLDLHFVSEKTAGERQGSGGAPSAERAEIERLYGMHSPEKLPEASPPHCHAPVEQLY